MTTKELEAMKEIRSLLQEIRNNNEKFMSSVNAKVESLASKVDTKHLPISLEQDILRTAQIAISDSMKNVLSSYNSPLGKLIESVINSHNADLRAIIDDAFSSVIKTQDFKDSIVNAFSHKIARTIISNQQGLFDKVSNELKQDAIFKAKISVAVANVVQECLKEKQS